MSFKLKNIVIHIILFIIRNLTRTAPFLIYILLWKTEVFLKYILRYRSKVIFTNLKRSFGNQYDDKQIKKIQNEYYHVLIRYIRETLYIISYDLKTLKSKIKLAESDKWLSFLSAQKSTIVTASHYGNWEMNMVMLPAFIQQRVVAFYKPISDKTVDGIMLKIRSAYGLELHPIEQTARIMSKYKAENVLYIFIGDQSPLNMNGVYWNTFLHQDTPWLTGAEKLARKFNYPILYLKQQPQADGILSYILQFQSITEHPELEAPGEITEQYSRILEKEIEGQPAFWLWSHKRWKRAHLK